MTLVYHLRPQDMEHKHRRVGLDSAVSDIPRTMVDTRSLLDESQVQRNVFMQTHFPTPRDFLDSLDSLDSQLAAPLIPEGAMDQRDLMTSADWGTPTSTQSFETVSSFPLGEHTVSGQALSTPVSNSFPYPEPMQTGDQGLSSNYDAPQNWNAQAQIALTLPPSRIQQAALDDQTHLYSVPYGAWNHELDSRNPANSIATDDYNVYSVRPVQTRNDSSRTVSAMSIATNGSSIQSSMDSRRPSTTFTSDVWTQQSFEPALTLQASPRTRDRLHSPSLAVNMNMPSPRQRPQMILENEDFSPVDDPGRFSPDTEAAKARVDPLYQAQIGEDGQYHCPWNQPNYRGEVTACTHPPTILKCNYDKQIDSHLKPYRCTRYRDECADKAFSSMACRLRHEREAHGMHGHGERPHTCPVAGCERATNGFPRRWNLQDHMKRVHSNMELPVRRSVSPGSATSLGNKKKRALPNESLQTQRKKSKTSASPLVTQDTKELSWPVGHNQTNKEESLHALKHEMMTHSQLARQYLNSLKMEASKMDNAELQEHIAGIRKQTLELRLLRDRLSQSSDSETKNPTRHNGPG